MRTILHLDGDAFFASVEKGINPILKDKPVIIGGTPDKRGCVHTASYEARRMGVVTGMNLRDARERCPDAVFLKGDFRHYRAVGKHIEEILYSYSPDIEITSLDDAYIDLTGVLNLHTDQINENTVADLVMKIQHRIAEEVHVPVSAGIGSSKLIARIASGINKPEGLTYVPNGKEKEFLLSLPIRQLYGIGRKSEMIFREIGINTIGGVAALPKETVIQLLGNAVGCTIWEYANGRDSRAVSEREKAGQISRETSFDEDTDDPELIKGTMFYLLDRIATKLRRMQWTAKRLKIKMRFADRTSAKKYITLPARTDDGALLNASAMELYSQMQKKRVKMRLIGAAVYGIEHKFDQCTLFENDARRAQLHTGIDSVRDKFGFMSVVQANTLELKKTYRMENHGYILHAPSLSQ